MGVIVGSPFAAGELAELTEAVTAITRRVAEETIMPRFLRVAREQKSDGTLFSEADLAAQHALGEALSALLPVPLVGEEMSPEVQDAAWQASGQEAGLAGGLWCFDPIDGTTNFINGLPFFATSVALVVGGVPVLGVTFAPHLEEMFCAWQGGGAWLNGQRLPLRQTTADLGRAVAAVDFKRIPRPLADRLASAPPFYSLRHFGASTLEWCYLAAGRLDAYLHGGQMLWDYAAGSLILAEAGGYRCTLTEDVFFRPGANDVWRRSIVAALDPRVFDAWRGWLRAVP